MLDREQLSKLSKTSAELARTIDAAASDADIWKALVDVVKNTSPVVVAWKAQRAESGKKFEPDNPAKVVADGN